MTDGSNGRVTMALLGAQVQQIANDTTDIKKATGDLHDFVIQQVELNKLIRKELWTPDGKSRVQSVEETANTAMTWAKAVLIPIGLALCVGILSLIWR